MALEGQKVGHTAAAVVKAASKNRFSQGGVVKFTEEVEASVSTGTASSKAVDTFLKNPKNPNAVTSLVSSLQDAQLRGKEVDFDDTALANAIEAAGLDPATANQIFKLAEGTKKRMTGLRTKKAEEKEIKTQTTGLMRQRNQAALPETFASMDKTYQVTIRDAIAAQKERQRIV